MDRKQLVKDIFTLNLSAFGTRFYKLVAVLKRQFSLPAVNFATAKNYKNIPVIINNRNRLTYLRQMISWLENAGYHNIIILDNQSNYQPLIDFYKTLRFRVVFLDKNYGHLALWKSGLHKEFYHDFYVYTDPDLVPVAACPDDFMKYFLDVLNRHKEVEKVGFGLKIDDLPDHYNRKEEVINWEKKFWEHPVEKDVYNAPLDTTFAVYKPYTNGAIWVQNALRTGGVYQMRHLPWYEDSQNLSDESVFYMNNMKKGASHWILKNDQ